MPYIPVVNPYMSSNRYIVACVHHTRAPTRVPHTTSICKPGIGTGEAGYLHGVWASRSPVTALVVAHTPIVSWVLVLDIPSPLSASSFWVRVRVGVRRCYRFSGLYAFHSSGDVVDGIRRPRIVVLMACKAPASSTLALLQCAGHCGCHIRSKSVCENGTVQWDQKRSQTSSACFVGTSAGIVVLRITRSQGARHSTTSSTPLHHSRRRLWQNPFRREKAALALFFLFCMAAELWQSVY